MGWDVGATVSIAQTGGFVELSDCSGRERGTEGAGVAFEEDDMAAGRKRILLGDCHFWTTLDFQTQPRTLSSQSLSFNL
jgi:hypothetical protein